jgi:protein SEY1
LLFSTKFEVMDGDNGRTQTTKGIWMAINQDSNILVFDIEGTDSKERGEQRLTFEQTTSLFALAIADVLLINMWTTDIGRYGASNYGLLKVIFEVNLKLFDQKSNKKLLFVLRDFDDRGNNFQKIQGILEADLNRIWSEIYKPDKFANSKPQDFF